MNAASSAGSGDSPRLPCGLRDSILERLGFSRAPSADLGGLRALYAAWCARVSFDNIGKMIALRSGSHCPLPGIAAGDFFDSWLRHGNGGTCWSTSNALFELICSLGFSACRIAGAMRDLGVVNHASVKVRIDGFDWIADSSLLTNEPLPLRQEVFVNQDAAFPVEVEPVDGTHILWFDNPPNLTYLPCRLTGEEVDHDYYIAGYERSRERSPFNQRLYVRTNRPAEMVVVLGHTRFSKTAEGVKYLDLSAEGLCRFLRCDLGISEELLDAWIRSGALDASFQPPSSPEPPPVTQKPPSQRKGN